MLGVWDFQAVNHLVFEYIFSNSSKDLILLVIIFLIFLKRSGHIFLLVRHLLVIFMQH